MKNKVSIIIPIYNAKEYIERCLESIFNQTYKNIEIIAINDGSKDDSLKILKNISKKHDNLKIIDQENTGVAKVRNRGIKEAKGKYIMFIDNDDYIDNDYVKSYVNKISIDDLDVVIGGYERVDNDGKVLVRTIPSNTPMGKYTIVAPWAKIYKLEFLKKNNIEFLSTNIGEDIYFNLKVMNMTNKIAFINNTSYKWFYNRKSISNTIHKKISKELQFEYLLDNCYKMLKNISKENIEENEYFFIKTVSWYIYYINKNNDKNKVYNEIIKYKKWLSNHYKNYKKNKYITVINKTGESIKIRMAVYLLMKNDNKTINKILLTIA